MPSNVYVTGTVWPYWVQTAGTNGTTYTANIWLGWCDQTATTGLTAIPPQTTVGAWNMWIGQTQIANNVVQNVGATAWEQREPTEAELAARHRSAYVGRIRARSFEVRRRVANRAAKALLLAHLRDEQRREFEQHDYFHVVTADGERRYRIRTGTHGNVRRVRGDGVEDRSYCIQPPGVPTYDAMLAQALMLETDEAEFLRVANAQALA